MEPIPRFTPVLGLATPPESPRKRRRFLRESEDTKGQLKIEEYLLKSDPYRSTSLPLLPPWPLRVTSAPADVVETIASLQSKINEILLQHDFPDTSKTLRVVQVTKPGYSNWLGTLLLQIQYHNIHLPRQLGPAKDEIRDLLIDHDLDYVHVEIARSDLVFNPSMFPIASDHPAVSAFERARSEIVQLLDTTLTISWRALGLYMVGRNENKALPTLVVMVDPGLAYDWSSIELKISKIFSADAFIEFIPGELSALAPPEQSGISFHDRMVWEYAKLQMGYSISVVGERGGGSMGCFLDIMDGQAIRRGFLTNYHVIRPSDTASREILSNLDRYGLSARPSDPNIEVSYLADKDASATKQDLEDKLRLNTELKASLHEKQEQREMTGLPPTPRIQDLVDNGLKRQSDLQRLVAVVDSMPETVGRVTLASGKSFVESKIIDWAFVELDDSSAELSMPNIVPTVPSSQTADKYGFEGHPEVMSRQPLAEDFGQLKKFSYYLKVGRTTGVTAGVSNGTLTTCNWSIECRHRYDLQGNNVFMQNHHTEEHVIFSKKSHSSQVQQTEFCDAGDAGSVIFNQDNQVCGLLYGSVSGFCGPDGDQAMYAGGGLVMSIDDFLQSVRDKIPNCKVKLT